MSDEEQKKVFSRNLNYYIKLNGKQQKEVANNIGENPTTLNMWCTGKSMPSLGKIQKLADYFKIGKSDLTEVKSNIDEKSEFVSIANKLAMQDDRLIHVVVEYYHLSSANKKLFCDFFEKFISFNGGES